MRRVSVKAVQSPTVSGPKKGVNCGRSRGHVDHSVALIWMRNRANQLSEEGEN